MGAPMGNRNASKGNRNKKYARKHGGRTPFFKAYKPKTKHIGLSKNVKRKLGLIK